MVIFRSRIVRRPTVLMQVIFVVLLNDEIGPNKLQHLHFRRWRRYVTFKDTVILKELVSAAAHTGQFSSISTKAKMFSVCLPWLCFLKLKQSKKNKKKKQNLQFIWRTTFVKNNSRGIPSFLKELITAVLCEPTLTFCLRSWSIFKVYISCTMVIPNRS